jgi:hypothetical protein
LSPQPKSPDGKAEDLSIKAQRALLTTKLAKYESMLVTLTEKEEPVLFKSCQDTITATKEQVMALNTPHDQLKNLQAAIVRKQKWAEDLTSQASSIQIQQLGVQTEILNLQVHEKKLISMISQQTPLTDTEVTEDQFLQAQLALSSMAQQLAQQQAEMSRFFIQLQSVPGLPDDVLKLVPGLSPGSPAAPTPMVGQSAPCTPYRPPGISAHSPSSPIPPGMPSTMPSFDNVDMEDSETYGPYSLSASRASPYGNTAEQADQPQVFGDAAIPVIDA